MVELFLWVCMAECCSLSLEIKSFGAALGFFAYFVIRPISFLIGLIREMDQTFSLCLLP